MYWQTDEFQQRVLKAVSKAQTGTPSEKKEAWTELYDCHHDSLLKMLGQKISSPELREDIVQETFAKAIKSIDSWNYVGVNFFSWLYKIAVNMVIDYYRSKSACILYIEDVAALERKGEEFESDTIDSMLFESFKEELAVAILGLTKEQQRVICLRYFEGFSIADVAMKMDKSENAIKCLSLRATKRLYGLLSGNRERWSP